MGQFLTALQGIVGIDPDGRAALGHLKKRFPDASTPYLVDQALLLTEALLRAEEQGFASLLRPADGRELPIGDFLP